LIPKILGVTANSDNESGRAITRRIARRRV